MTPAALREACEVVISAQDASTDVLRRRLHVDQPAAAELLDALADAGIVTAPDETGNRRVLARRDEQLAAMVHIYAVQRQAAKPRPLAPQHRHVLRMLADGKTAQEIAEHLHKTEKAVRTVMQEARRRLGARTMPHAIARAYDEGVLVPQRSFERRAA